MKRKEVENEQPQIQSVAKMSKSQESNHSKDNKNKKYDRQLRWV